MKITDWIQALSALAVAVFTYFLWRLAARQTDLIQKNVQIAKVAADAAKKSAETAERALIGVQRPLFKVVLGRLEIEPPTKASEFENYRVQLVLTNVGREPAITVASAVQFVPCLSPMNPPKPGARRFDPVWAMTDMDVGIVVMPEQEITFQVERLMDAAEGETLENFQHIRGRLFIYGIIVYDDLVGIRRQMAFTYGWDVDEGVFFRCGLDGHNFDRMTDPDTNPIVYVPI